LKKTDLRRQVAAAVGACQTKKAGGVSVLQMGRDGDGFTDYFVICSGSNPRQVQAISDEVEQKLSTAGLRPTHVEGYQQAEWVLLDFVDFVVHIFQEKARKFYDLERLWKSAKRLNAADLARPASRARKSAASAARRAPQKKAAKARAGGKRTAAKSRSSRARKG
jgi:ribosome-associated protein